MKVAFLTLGCKVNQYETQILEQYFENEGFSIVNNDENADIFVINSCTVTAASDKKTRQIIGKFKRKNKNSIVVLTGCMPQAFPEETSLLEDVDVVTGAYNRKGLILAVKRSLQTGEKVIDITTHSKNSEFEEMSLENFKGQTRAFLKIQDGCERFCAYCIIPTARGPLRSKPLEKINDEAKKLSNNGFKEIVLVGINLSCYGVDSGSNLVEAVRMVNDVRGVDRIRLGSLEPEFLEKEKLLELKNVEKFCPQFHLSLQSGSDKTLKRMKRHYSTIIYKDIVDNIRNIFVNPSITTDIMVGFPGETKNEFNESLAFIKEIKLARAHVFPYSRRKGTEADLMDEQIPQDIKNQRSKKVMEIVKETQKTFLQSQKNKTVSVLFESYKDGYWYGYSENYTRVFVKSNEKLANIIKKVNIIDFFENSCEGIIL